MGDLLQLAERCEQATGPDRLLDVAIDDLLGGCPGKRAHLTPTDIEQAEGQNIVAERYSASLDAAMTLVPEGWSVTLHAHPDNQCRASVWQGDRAGNFSYAATPALALCAAALRSHHMRKINEADG